MSVQKRFTILPDNGVVAGGSASYIIDPVTGHINYQVSLLAHYLFSNHALNSSGVYNVNPKLLKSANVVDGEIIDLGFAEITILAVEGKAAKAHAVIKGYGEGDANLSLAKDTIELMSIHATGSVMGMGFTLVVQ